MARRKRCACGECQQCLDDARWERIFQAKFAKRDYYSDDVWPWRTPAGSSFNAFAAMVRQVYDQNSS